MLPMDQKTARELEYSLGRYAMWMGQLRGYARRHYGLELRADLLPGCVLHQDLKALYGRELCVEAERTADWCWAVDAVCRRLQAWDAANDVQRFSGLLRLYYGFGLDTESQKKWMEQPSCERRRIAMRSLHMEQTTFYQVRSQLLAALYTAAVQRGLYRPYPEEGLVHGRAHAAS